jgi:uncharacterized protein
MALPRVSALRAALSSSTSVASEMIAARGPFPTSRVDDLSFGGRRALHFVAGPAIPRGSFLPGRVRQQSSLATSGGGGGSGLAGLTNIVDRDDGLSFIRGHDRYGFDVNGIKMRGSVIVFPYFTLLWNVARVLDVSPRSLAVAHMIKPRPEHLIIGTGDQMENINPSLYAYFARRGISIEAQSTVHAIAAFNMLVREGRPVAAALVARTPMTRDDASLFTQEPVLSEADKRLQRVLSRDLTAQEAARMITDGQSGVGDAGEEARRAAASRQAEKAAAANEARVVFDRSRELGVQYGVPGAIVPDIAVVDKLEAQRTADRLTRPQTQEDLDMAKARKAARRSGSTGSGGYKY